MPLGARFKCPVIHIVCHLFRIAVFPFFAVYNRRNERTDIVAVAENLLTCFDNGFNSFYPQFFTCFAFMHFCIYVKCGKELVQRRCRGMHHECVVHPFMRYITILSFNVGVFLVYLGSHGETCLLFVDGLSNENPRIFRSKL